jgi:hypothetical protein
MAEDAKMCPILTSGWLSNEAARHIDIIRCKEDSCEFWDKDNKECGYKKVIIIKQNG